MTATRRRRTNALHVVIVTVFALTGIAVPASRAATVWLVTFTIDDAWSTSNALFSDADVTGTNEYKDYRLGSGDESDLNFCVEASPYGRNMLFIRFNRKLDGDDGVQRCDTPTHEYSNGTQRQYSLLIDNDSACWELGSNGYLSDDASTWHRPCRIVGGVNPRIRMGDPWVKNPRFAVDFLTTNPTEPKGSATSYVVESTANATILSGPNNTRIVTYGGMARLHKFAPNSVGVVAEPFPLPFHMTLVRTSQ